jgi:hypothetical protein
MKRTGTIVALFSMLLVAACGRTDDAATSWASEFRVQNGRPLVPSELPAVVAVGGCSGSLIREDWVITASHCVEWDGDDAGAISVNVVGEEIRVVRVEFPERPEGRRHFGNDLALLRLARPVRGVEPMFLFEGQLRESERVSIVGYGENENGERGKRLGTMALGTSYLDYGSTHGIRNTLFFQATDERQSACGGDSGGAVLRFVAGTPRLAGVMVGAGFAQAGKCGTSESMIAVNMAAYAPWIGQVTGGARLPIGPAPTCTVRVSPGSVRLPDASPNFVEFTVTVEKPGGVLDHGGPNGLFSLVVGSSYLREGVNRTRLGPGSYSVRKTVISESHGVVGECAAPFEVQAGPAAPTATPVPPRPSPTATPVPPRPTPTPVPPRPTPTPSVVLRPATALRIVRAGPVQAILRWNDASENESGYQVFRSEAAKEFVVVATLAANAGEYHDRGLRPNVRYRYRVRAFDGQGRFADSAVLTVPAARNNGIASR